jgi:type IV secretory pathway VirB2 component (pilin)
MQRARAGIVACILFLYLAYKLSYKATMLGFCLSDAKSRVRRPDVDRAYAKETLLAAIMHSILGTFAALVVVIDVVVVVDEILGDDKCHGFYTIA